jgi:lysozyme
MNRLTRAALFAAALLAAGVFAFLIYAGAIRFNRPSEADYPVRGVDVSEYQGEIDWAVLAAQGIDFAYIKATKGSSHVDPYFAQNIRGALAAGLRAGAYHFFSFDSAGLAQAENFIAAAPAIDGMLPPAIDLELYGAYKLDPKPADEVWSELQDTLDALEAAYGKRPVIYVTGRAYDLYMSGRDVPYDIWIRSVFFAPRAEDWVLWQYSDKGKLDGYSGKERYIDLDVFRGSEAEFEAY